MLKKLANSKIDNMMEFWKDETSRINKSQKSQEINNIYNEVREQFSDESSTTTVYTEDEEICGYIITNKDNKILGILVKEAMRREGIGTRLIENCQKKVNKMNVEVSASNKVAIIFFQKNGFVTQKDEDDICYMEWNKDNKSLVKLVYFDNDIDEKYLKSALTIPYESMNIQKIIEDSDINNSELYSIKSYMKFRKKIESIMNSEIILLYIDYNNYYKYLDDQIKEIAKIKRIKLKVLLCEPFSIENSKKSTAIKQIEQSFKNYDIVKVDCTVNSLQNDIAINQIFDKRMEILVDKIQSVAQNV